jgi:hypothetical protein
VVILRFASSSKSADRGRSIIQVISRVVVPDVVLLSQTSASGKLVTVKTKVNNSDEEARNEFHEMASINPCDLNEISPLPLRHSIAVALQISQ